MPKIEKTVRLRIRTSFNGMYEGDEADVLLNEKVEGWIRSGVAEVVPDGTDQAGPGEPEPDDAARVQDRAPRGVKAGRQSRQGFGGGAYGAPAGVDKG